MRIRSLLALTTLAIIGSTLAIGEAHQIDPRRCAGSITKFDTPGGVFYVDDHGDNPPAGPPGLNEWWLYMESNGHKGLQKGGYNPVLLALLGPETTEDPLGERDRCDTTRHKSHPRRLKPDTILF